MATTPLCTSQDLITFGNIPDSVFESGLDLEDIINELSTIIRAEAEDEDIVRETPYAKLCCVFGVKMFLEDTKRIAKSKGNISSLKDGDFQVNYFEGKFQDEMESVPDSSRGKFQYYLSKLTTFDFQWTGVEHDPFKESTYFSYLYGSTEYEEPL